MQVEYKTEKGTVLFVKIEEDVLKCKIEDNWQLIGFTSEITEKQAKMMVDSVSGIAVDYFKDYSLSVYSSEFQFAYETGLGSFNSLMQHLKVEHPSVVLFKPNK